MASEGFHEDPQGLSPESKDRHRAIVSLMEELEAIDWYDQRIEACADPALKAILAHNRDEEKEHAAMVLEWLRRNDPAMAEALRTYLFRDGSIHEIEEAATGGGAPAAREEPRTAPSERGTAPSVGSLRGTDSRG